MTDAAMIAVRWVQSAAALILFGSALFALYAPAPPKLSRVWQGACVLVLASGLAWLMLQAVAFTGEPSAAFDVDTLRSVLTETQFGHALMVRLALAALLLVFSNKVWFQAGMGGALAASGAWIGHGMIDEGVAGLIHGAGDILHLLAAGAWIGALAPLAMLAAAEDVKATEKGLAAFSKIGIAVVAVLILSGVVNSWFLIGPGHITDIFASAYGLVLLAKLVLFGAMLCLAAANRYWLTPRLQADDRSAMAAARASVIGEMCLGLLVLAAVAWLGMLAPPISA